MKRLLILFLFSISLFSLCGCEPIAEIDQSDQDLASIHGLTLQDIRGSQTETLEPDMLLSFRILTYEIDPEYLDQLRIVMDMLSQTQVRYYQKNAFEANGFLTGAGHPDLGPGVAKGLVQSGAVRRTIKKLSTLAETTEVIIPGAVLPGQPIDYITSGGASQTFMPTMGLGGWTLTAIPDPRFRGMVQISLVPAFWQRGAEDLRLRLGQEPLNYQFIEEGRVLARIEERGFVVLAPNRPITQENTLDKVLFSVPNNPTRLRIFVVICDDAGL